MEHRTIYSPDTIASLELGWGKGWLSPGGASEVAEILAGMDIKKKSVLDIGTGTGGPALLLASKFSAAHVTGIDIEQSVIERARDFAKANALKNKVEFQCVSPGPLSFPDAHFDVIFSKDAFVHIADKSLLFAEAYRVLKPGGWCVFSDWCCSEPPYSEEMEQFFDNGMHFSMATIRENIHYLERSGFQNISNRDRNDWFAEFAAREFRAAAGPRRARIISEVGLEAARRLTAAAKRRAIIAEQGHLRPTHFRARKPNR